MTKPSTDTPAVQDAITRALADEQHGLTPELGERLIAAAKRLPHIEQIAFSCGVSPRLLVMWLRAGVRQRIEPFATFALMFFEAESSGLGQAIAAIEKDLNDEKPKNATARLAFLKWRFGEHGQAGTTPTELMGKLLREQKD